MGARLALLTAAAVLTTGTARAAVVKIEDAVVRVTVIPEARSDVKVEVTRPSAKLPLSIRTDGGRTIIDGGLARIGDCSPEKEGRAVTIGWMKRIAWEDVPQVVIRTPRAVSIATDGAVWGVIGRSEGLDLRNSQCSRWTIADVAGPASVRESGASQIRMGSAEKLDLRISGAGRFSATRVRDATARLSGAGQVRIGEVTGHLAADVSGAGQVDVGDGRVGRMQAEISGVGQVRFGGIADSLDARVSGLGQVRVAEVRGPVTKQVSGAGSVNVGRQVAAVR